MKKHIVFILIVFFIAGNIKAQIRTKDTLFFNIDPYYSISPTITPNLSNRTYSEMEEAHKEQMKHTQTNGYIYFVGNGYLTKNLKPKKVLSIKDYIENRTFYLDGKYNKIVDKWKLKDSLTNKYKIYFVHGDEFIEPRFLEYNSYYPIGKGEDAIVNKVKDTLCFKLDTKYVKTYAQIPDHFYLSDSGNAATSGAFFLRKVQSSNHIKFKNLLSIEEFVHSSRFYNKDKTQKLNDYELAEYLSNYVLFLVRDQKTQYVQVEPGFVIE